MDKECKYDICWKGRCNKETVEGKEYCLEHLGIKCHKCDQQSIGDCHGFNGSFVCGYPMCEDHKHNWH